jgi:hypothetical protein
MFQKSIWVVKIYAGHGSEFVLRYQEKMQMRKQCRRTTWGTGMNPTGRYAHMFEERGEKEIYPNDNRDPYKEE